jgi:phosphoribosylaminoimidazole-succinocarboxamide synthase
MTQWPIDVQGLMSQADWDTASSAAMQLFAFGQTEALKRGLLLVDTKYEFGQDADGNVLLIDEIHTPDSSRYWMAHSYEERHAVGDVRNSLHTLRHGPTDDAW